MFILSKNIYTNENLALLAANISLDEFKILSKLREKRAFIAIKALSKEQLFKELELLDSNDFYNNLVVLNRLGLVFMDEDNIVISKDGIDVTKIIDSINSKGE